MKVIYEDNDIIVIVKPAGMATQSAGVGAKDLETELKKYRKLKGEKPEIYVVHRLDQPVEGVMVFAKTENASKKLSMSMRDQEFSKIYEARVLKPESVSVSEELTDFLLKDEKTNTSKVVDKSRKGAKEAKLKYEVISKDEKTMTLKVTLFTGRHHQIRVQLSNAGMPILGDLKYGSEESKLISKEEGIKFICLKAVHLEFTHPETGEKLSFDIGA